MYTMKQACEQVNLPYETLKFYCNEGLIPNVKRNENNHRIFDDNDIQWINNLSCLKDCGMSIKDMRIYVELCLEGEQTIPQRQAMLQVQQDNLLCKLQLITDNLSYINQKQQLYADILSGKIPYLPPLNK